VTYARELKERGLGVSAAPLRTFFFMQRKYNPTDNTAVATKEGTAMIRPGPAKKNLG